MPEIVGVKFRNGCEIHDFDTNSLELLQGDTVIVDTESGLSYGRVATPKRCSDTRPSDRPNMKKVVRRTTNEDMKQLEKNLATEERALKLCQARISERDIPMKLVSVEMVFDGSKATFLYTADGRVDFRELVKDLAANLHTRIEMRQIGVRDEARTIGGYGPCGQQLCCTTFIKDFEPVSIKMAKEQGLALNPAKISGVCGRLMCCLAFEYEGGGCGGKEQGGGTCGHAGHGGGGGGHPCHGPAAQQGGQQAKVSPQGQQADSAAKGGEGQPSRSKWSWRRKKKKKKGDGGGQA